MCLGEGGEWEWTFVLGRKFVGGMGSESVGWCVWAGGLWELQLQGLTPALFKGVYFAQRRARLL